MAITVVRLTKFRTLYGRTLVLNTSPKSLWRIRGSVVSLISRRNDRAFSLIQKVNGEKRGD